MRQLMFLLSLILITSCEKVVEQPTRMFDGSYNVTYKVWIEPNGTEKLFVPIGTDITNMNITGWMSPTKLVFTSDSLGIFQLMDQGWSDGYVDLEWVGDTPYRVGCHYVESADEVQISWYQDDVIIRWFLIKE